MLIGPPLESLFKVRELFKQLKIKSGYNVIRIPKPSEGKYESIYFDIRPAVPDRKFDPIFISLESLSELHRFQQIEQPLAHNYCLKIIVTNPLQMQADEKILNKQGLVGFAHHYHNIMPAIYYSLLFEEEQQILTTLKQLDKFSPLHKFLKPLTTSKKPFFFELYCFALKSNYQELIQYCKNKLPDFLSKLKNDSPETVRDFLERYYDQIELDKVFPTWEQKGEILKTLYIDDVLKVLNLNDDETETTSDLTGKPYEKEVDFNDIQAGVAPKYSGVNKIAKLPCVSGKTKKKFNHDISLQQINSLNSSNDHKRYSFNVGVSKFSLYSCKKAIKSNDNCIFVFSGRKDEAFIPKPMANHRIICVVTRKEFKSIKKSNAIDYLVINKLESEVYGKYKNVGYLVCRRAAAFLVAHHFNLKQMLTLDDNIKKLKFNTTDRVTNKWDAFWQMLSADMHNTLCVSIPCISNKPKFLKANKRTLGYKVFMFNMQAIKGLMNIEDLFTLQMPAKFASCWGEDYMIQLMLEQVSPDYNGFKVLPRKQAGFIRSDKNQNAFANNPDSIKAEFYSSDQNLFLNDNKSLLTLKEPRQKQVRKAYLKIKQIVLDSRKMVEEYNAQIKTIDLMKAHANANDVKYHKKVDQALDKNKINKNIFETLGESVKACDFLYEHQMQAVEAVASQKKCQGSINMATGTGKTMTQAALAFNALQRQSNQPIFIVTPSLTLLKQAYEDFKSYLPKFNEKLPVKIQEQQIVKISSREQDISELLLTQNDSLVGKNCIFIFCADSYKLFAKSEGFQKYNPAMVLFDEYHLYNKQAKELLELHQDLHTKPLTFGLTATLPKHDCFQKNIFTFSRQDALKEKILAPLVVERFNKKAKDIPLTSNPVALVNVLKQKVHPNGKPLTENKGIIYVRNIKQADAMKSAFQSNGIVAFCLHSKNKNCNEELEKYKKLSKGILIAVKMGRVGLNVPNASWAISLQNHSKPEHAADVCQIIGRVLRTTPDDPQKIGYFLGFKDVNLSSLEVRVDKEAKQNAHPKFILAYLKKRVENYFNNHFKENRFKEFMSLSRKAKSNIWWEFIKNNQSSLAKLEVMCKCLEAWVDGKHSYGNLSFQKRLQDLNQCDKETLLMLNKLVRSLLPFTQGIRKIRTIDTSFFKNMYFAYDLLIALNERYVKNNFKAQPVYDLYTDDLKLTDTKQKSATDQTRTSNCPTKIKRSSSSNKTNPSVQTKNTKRAKLSKSYSMQRPGTKHKTKRKPATHKIVTAIEKSKSLFFKNSVSKKRSIKKVSKPISKNTKRPTSSKLG